LTQDFKKYADRVVQGERVLVLRPYNENLVIISEQEYNKLEQRRKKSLKELGETISSIRKRSVVRGTSELTMDEINGILAED